MKITPWAHHYLRLDGLANAVDGEATLAEGDGQVLSPVALNQSHLTGGLLGGFGLDDSDPPSGALSSGFELFFKVIHVKLLYGEEGKKENTG